MKTSEVFRRAGDILRTRGWYQGAFESTDGPVCVLGSLNAARTGDPWSVSGCYPSDRFLQRIVRQDLALWNDSPNRTESDVRQALDPAYVLALQEEGLEPEDVLK